MSERGGLPRTGGVPSPHMQPSKPVSITSNRPVHMNLYATWEVDRSSPSCVPRYVCLSVSVSTYIGLLEKPPLLNKPYLPYIVLFFFSFL